MSKPCPYCNKPPKLVYGLTLFPHLPKLSDKAFWRCEPCKAHVGCHEGTTKPYGSLANSELRNARLEAHGAFDQIWKLRYMSRTKAYEWLAAQLGISVKECHIGLFDVDTCMIVRALGREKMQELMMS